MFSLGIATAYQQINDNILSLEKKIREAFACGQKLMTVFFDIDTYGTT